MNDQWSGSGEGTVDQWTGSAEEPWMAIEEDKKWNSTEKPWTAEEDKKWNPTEKPWTASEEDKESNSTEEPLMASEEWNSSDEDKEDRTGSGVQNIWTNEDTVTLLEKARQYSNACNALLRSVACAYLQLVAGEECRH